MLAAVAVLLVVLLLPALKLTVEGHGMLLDPPQRSSLWRDDRFPEAPINNQDSGLFCGGFNVSINTSDISYNLLWSFSLCYFIWHSRPFSQAVVRSDG